MKELSIKELIDTARGCADDMVGNACVKCAFHASEGDCASELLLALADTLEAALATQGDSSASAGVEWIDVKDALPAQDDEYLVMVAGAKKPTVLYFDVEHNGFYQEDCDGEGIWHCVTHWAEIPSLSIKADEVVSSEQASRRRCATCAYEDRMAESDRCIECEKHSLWEEKI